MWGALRDGAYNWAQNALEMTSATPPTPQEVQAAADNYIGHVTIMDMNRYVKMAGEFLSARDRLMSLDPGDQITGTEIFRPEWAKTTNNPAVPERYRIRVLRNITVSGFTQIEREEWGEYEISGPLTSVEDALRQADQLWGQGGSSFRAKINYVVSYDIRAV
jgi:hypothetical protein